jgi:ABC-type sugar transport system ATPase subunit
MGEATPVVAVQSVAKRFGAVQALRGVSLDVRAGEVLALVGENGAGKSTLRRVLDGVFEPDGGRILVEGKPVRFRGPA